MSRRCVLVRYGEIGTKSRITFRNFIKKLLKNIEESLNVNNISYDRIVNPKGRIIIYTKNLDSSINAIKRVFGVQSLSSAIKTDIDLKEISESALNLFNDLADSGSKFRVSTQRLSKGLEMDSMEISRKVGSYILDNGIGDPKVDLEDYDIEINIEIFNDKAFIFSKNIEGYGGLPIGSQGEVIALISGKNSALAAWLMMKRGCKVHPVNFETDVFSDGVEDLMGVLDKFSYGSEFDPEYISFNKEKEDVNLLIKEFKRETFYKPLIQMKMVQKGDELVEKRNSIGMVMGNTLESEKDLKIIRMNNKVSDSPIFYPIISGNKKILSKNEVEDLFI